jgi:hypothetical protein
MVANKSALQVLTTTVVKMVVTVGETLMVLTEGAITIEVVVADPDTEEEVDVVEDEAWDEGATEEEGSSTASLTIQITQQNILR